MILFLLIEIKKMTNKNESKILIDLNGDTFKIEESKNLILSKFSGEPYFRPREEVEKELENPNFVIIYDDFS